MSLFFLGLQKELLSIHDSIEKRSELSKNKGVVKNAFDTRRVNQGEQFNPRRNLQNFQRSEPFITPEISNKIKTFFKIKSAADQIKEEFMGDPEWLDSNSRILCNALNNTLRVDQKDYDFFKPQFDYIDELLYLRYRLASEDVEKMSEEQIRDKILARDECLLHKSLYANYSTKESLTKISDREIPMVKQTVISQEDSLMEKLFGGVKASGSAKNVKRSVNITISDSIEDEKELSKKE